MGIEYQLGDGVIRFRTTGEVEYASGLDVLRAGFGAAADRPGTRWGLLFDIRESAENRSETELRGIAAAVGDHRHLLTGRCAIVASDPLHYGLARMACVYLDGLGLRAGAFGSVDEAEEWVRGTDASCGLA